MIYPVELIAPVPSNSDPGYFGAVRKYDIHTGIDLYCNDGAKVTALYDGIVVNIEKFTGEHANSPWWNNTWSLIIEDRAGVIVYGEIIPNPNLYVGCEVNHGDVIGIVKQVLRVDKKVTPTSMLHIELYTPDSKNSLWWNLNSIKPLNLLNPEIIFNPLKYMKYVKIKLDCMSSICWDIYDRNISMDLLPISSELKTKIIDYITEYNSLDFFDESYKTYKTDLYINNKLLEIKQFISSELSDWVVE